MSWLSAGVPAGTPTGVYLLTNIPPRPVRAVWGFDDTLIDTKRHLTLADLDAAAPHNPVFVSHANGDQAIESVLQAFEKVHRRYPRPDARHMLIHCQLASRFYPSIARSTG